MRKRSVKSGKRGAGLSGRLAGVWLPLFLLAATSLYFYRGVTLAEQKADALVASRDRLAAEVRALTERREELTRRYLKLEGDAVDLEFVSDMLRRDLGWLAQDETAIVVRSGDRTETADGRSEDER